MITLNKLIINVHNVKKQIYIKTYVNDLTINTFILLKVYESFTCLVKFKLFLIIYRMYINKSLIS